MSDEEGMRTVGEPPAWQVRLYFAVVALGVLAIVVAAILTLP